MSKFTSGIKNGFSKLSKREKVLLYILVIAVIVVAGWRYILMPSIDRYSAASEREAAASLSYMNMKNTISAETSNAQLADEYTKKIKLMNQSYNTVMANYGIDMLVTGIVTNAGLTPDTLEIMTGYTPSVSSNSSGEQTSGTTGSTAGSGNTSSSGSSSSSSSSSSGSSASTDQVEVRYAKITATGSLAKCVGLADSFRTAKGMRVAEFKINGGGTGTADSTLSSGTTTQTTSKGNYSIDITVEVSMSRSKK